MRVFLDTNVLVSAFATRGLCADLIRLVLAEHELVVGEVVLEELRRVLLKKFGMPEGRVAEIEQFLRQHELAAVPDEFEPFGLRDPDDELVLATAVVARTEILVTGDRDLLDEAQHIVEVSVLSPREFWDRIRAA